MFLRVKPKRRKLYKSRVKKKEVEDGIYIYTHIDLSVCK